MLFISCVLFYDFCQLLGAELGALPLKITSLQPAQLPQFRRVLLNWTWLGHWTCAQPSIVPPESVPHCQGGLSGQLRWLARKEVEDWWQGCFLQPSLSETHPGGRICPFRGFLDFAGHGSASGAHPTWWHLLLCLRWELCPSSSDLGTVSSHSAFSFCCFVPLKYSF